MLESLQDVLINLDRPDYMFAYGYQHTDERGDVIRKAKEVAECLERSEKELAKANLKVTENFFEILQQAVKSVEQRLVRH